MELIKIPVECRRSIKFCTKNQLSFQNFIRSTKIIQPKAEPKLELSRLTKWSKVLSKFNPVCSPEIRSAIIIQPNTMPKLKLPLIGVQLLS